MNIDQIKNLVRSINTPKCVLIFLLKYIGVSNISDINLDDFLILSDVIKFIIDRFELPNTNADIARFINPSIDKWNKKLLLEAYNYFNKSIKGLINITSYGYQTLDNIYTCNSFVLWYLCIKEDISINFNTTEEEMFQELKSITIKDIDNRMNFSTINTLYTRLDYIIYCAKTYKYNILYSKNPRKELEAFLNKDVYDKRMKFVLSLNPNAYDLNEIYEISFPIEVYEDNNYKFQDIKYNNYYEYMVTNQFHNGYLHWCYNTTNTDLYEFKPSDTILSYGSVENMIAYDIIDLNNNFLAHNDFDNMENGYFTDKEIDNLLLFSNETLKETINKIRSNYKDYDLAFNRVISKYGKDSCLFVLYEVLESGMYMRSWDGKSDYPLEDTYVKDKCFTESLSFITANDLIYNNSEIYESVLSLPLLLYIRDDNYFKRANKDNGKTIKDRLIIIRNKKGTKSCIRLSSNYICSTCYYYISQISEPPFDLSKLSNIS